MSKKNYTYILFLCTIYLIALIIFTQQTISLHSGNFELKSKLIFLICLISCVLLGRIALAATEIKFEFTDGIIAFLYVYNGSNGIRTAIFFATLYLIISLLLEKLANQKRSFLLIFFDLSMIIITAYLAGLIANYINQFKLISNFDGNKGIIYTIVFIFINVFILQSMNAIKFKRSIMMDLKTIKFILISNVISIMTFIILYLIAQTYYGILGCTFFLIFLMLFNYCFYLFSKLKVKNEQIKVLLDITETLSKYGPINQKSEELAIALKNLVPYSTCAIFFFKDSEMPTCYNSIQGIEYEKLHSYIGNIIEDSEKIRKMEPLAVTDISKDKVTMELRNIYPALVSIVCIPIELEDRLGGFIFMAGGTRLKKFIMDDSGYILNILSKQIAIAYINNSIYRDVVEDAKTDALTNIYTRGVFDKEINLLVEKYEAFSFVIFDIDDFKLINDTYGHVAGDKILKLVADEIMNTIRKTDIACRYGGEELVIIFKNLEKELALEIAERIRKNVAEHHILLDGQDISVTLSGGISAFPGDGKDAESIINCADKILYEECKLKGKNKVSI